MTPRPGEPRGHEPGDLSIPVGSEYNRAASGEDIDLSAADRCALAIHTASEASEAIAAALRGMLSAPQIACPLALFLAYERAGDQLRGAAWQALEGDGSSRAGSRLDTAVQGVVVSLDADPNPWARVCRERDLIVVPAKTQPGLCDLLPTLREQASDLAFVPVATEAYLGGVLVLQLPHAAARPGDGAFRAALAIAGHLAQRLYRLELAGADRQEIEAFRVVEEAAEEVIGASSLPDVFSILARAASRALRAQRTIIWSFDQVTQRLDLAAQHVAVSSEAMDTLLPRLRDLAARCAQGGAGFLYPDLRADQEMDLAAWPDALPVSVIPMKAFGETLGVAASVARLEGWEEQPFDERDERIFKLLVHQGAVAVKVARQADDRKASEQRLKEMQKMLISAEKLASIGELSARLAEDIRGPISAVAGFARQLEKTLPEEESTRDDARILAQEAARIEDILVEQIQLVKESTPKMGVHQINRIVHESVTLLREEMTGRGIFVEETYADHLPDLLLDEARIKHMLINILRNALERTRDGDTIRLETLREGDRLLLEIAHTGDSLPGDILESLFVPFSTDRPAGAGLGLAVANQAVKEHGGEISVRAEGEWGSIYTISLPIQANRERRIPAPRRSGRDRRKGRAA